jgi:hypothetical protein
LSSAGGGRRPRDAVSAYLRKDRNVQDGRAPLSLNSPWRDARERQYVAARRRRAFCAMTHLPEGDARGLLRYRLIVDSDIARRLRLTLELFEAGHDLMLQNFRRKHPDETEAQIRERLGEWLRGTERAVPGRPYTFRYTSP